MSDHKSPDEIEREIEAERGALTRSLEDLQHQLSPDALIDTATRYVRENGGDFAANVSRQVKENPLALVVTGAGLAWLIAGPARKRAPTYDRWEATHDTTVGSETAVSVASGGGEPHLDYDHRRYPRAAGLRTPDRSQMSFEDRVARAEGDTHEQTTWEKVSDAAGNAAREAKARLTSVLPDRSKENMMSTRNDPYAYGRDRNSDFDSTPSLRDRLAYGTDNMSQAARERVMQARKLAHDAQRDLEARFGDYASAGRNGYNSQPLVGGLIALGIGAAIGAALPRTRQEDRYLGAYRDRAVSEAERIYHEESGNLKAVASAALDEAKSAANKAVEDVKAGAKSSTDAARDEAEKRDLGGSVG